MRDPPNSRMCETKKTKHWRTWATVLGIEVGEGLLFKLGKRGKELKKTERGMR